MTSKRPVKLLRFADLKDRGIVRNWAQLRRLQDVEGFPPGFMLSQNTRVWDEPEVEAWLASRRLNGPRAA
jgi:hypothetical protein